MSFLPIVNNNDIEAVKNLSRSERNTLLEEINRADPHSIFVPHPKENSNPDKRNIFCPICGNGSGDDSTPVEVTFNGNRWLYFCFKCGDFSGDLLKIIASEEHLNLNQGDDMCKALAIGANLIGYPLYTTNTKINNQEKSGNSKSQKDSTLSKEFLQLVHKDIQDAQFHLQDLPKDQHRSLSLHTMAHFGFGFLEQWIHPNFRLEGKWVTPTRRIIIPSDNHYNAVALPDDRKRIEKKYWKMHTKPMELFNSRALSSDSDLILVTEGEIDAASVWQAFEEKISVIAVLGVANWKATLLPKLDGITNKKFLILFDAEPDSRKQAQNLRDELVKRGFPATCRFFYDALLNRLPDNPNDTFQFDVKIDANQILQDKHEDFLRTLTQELIDSARADFYAIKKDIALDSDFKIKISAWKSQNHDAPIPPHVVEELKAAISYVDSMSTENFNPLDVDDLIVRRKIALLKFYVPTLARKFFNILRDVRDSARKKLKETNEPTEDIKTLAKISPSAIDKDTDKIVTEIARAQKQHVKEYKQKLDAKKSLEQWKKKQSQPKNSKYELSTEQVNTLFSMPNTDFYNAIRLDYLFGNEIRFLEDCDRWLTFDKKKGIWIKGNTGKNSPILPFAGIMMKCLEQNEPSPLESNYSENRTKSIIKTWQNNGKISAATNLLKAVTRIRITADDLDKHSNLLNCKNGVVDLQTSKFYEIVDPALLITQQCNAIYRPDYHNETIEKFLCDILPDEATRVALIRYLGYCLTGCVNEEVALFVYGTGGNGKGTLTKLLMTLLNNYAASIPVTAVIEAGRFKDAGAATPELNVLEKCRLAIVEELPQGGRLDVAKFKILTGGDKIPIRRLHEEFHNIEPTHKLFLSGNHMPILSDTHDPGLLRRLLNMNFYADFTQNPDRHLKEKLLTNEALSGFLTLLVAAAQCWYRDGLIVTSAMKDATHRYLAENDFIVEFISEFCTRDEEKSIDRKSFLNKLKEEYPAECSQLSDRALTEIVSRVNGISYRRTTGGERRFFGIKWICRKD